MTWCGRRGPRPVVLTFAAVCAVLVGHLLDALRLLPGVHEDAAVRAASLAPSYVVVTVLGAVLLACGTDRLLSRRRPLLALVALVAGQLALLGLPEVLGREAAGQGEQWGALAVAVTVQAVLASGAVVTALLVEGLLARVLDAPTPSPPTLDPPDVVAAATEDLRGSAPGAVRMRGPPVPVVP